MGLIFKNLLFGKYFFESDFFLIFFFQNNFFLIFHFFFNFSFGKQVFFWKNFLNISSLEYRAVHKKCPGERHIVESRGFFYLKEQIF